MRRLELWAGVLLATVTASNIGWAENAPGVTDTEIRLGQTVGYSGIGAAVAGPLGRAEQAYFRMINDQGGINGRKLVLESLDDGFDPKRALELTKKLVEQDHVAAIVSTFGTPSNLAIRDYLNAGKVPQLFIATGDDISIDYKHYPWITGGVPVFRIEVQIFGRYILVNMPTAKVGILRGRDEMGEAYITGLKQGLGKLYEQHVVKEIAFNDEAPATDAALAELRTTGADALITVGPPLVVADVIAKTHDMGWPATRFINFAASTPVTLGTAGWDKAKGIITGVSYIDPTNPRWIEDGTAKPFLAFVAKYLPGSGQDIGYYLAGYVIAQAMVQTLRQCSSDLSRDNIMAQALNLRDFHPVGLLPGIGFSTIRTKHLPIVEAALQRFDGQHWVEFGEIMAGF